MLHQNNHDNNDINDISSSTGRFPEIRYFSDDAQSHHFLFQQEKF